MEWLETANGIITLISALIALIGTGTGVFFAIKNFIKLMKSNTKEQNWKLIMKIADTAIKTAETSGKNGGFLFSEISALFLLRGKILYLR